MNKVTAEQFVDNLRIILIAWQSWQEASAALIRYAEIWDAENRNPNDEEWNALINSIEANQTRINELAAQ